MFATIYEYGTFFNDINDSLLLAKQLFPEILQLSTITDYKDYINSLLATLVDSNFVIAKDYGNYFTKIYFDAKLELKKQQGKDELLVIARVNCAAKSGRRAPEVAFQFLLTDSWHD